MKIIFFVADRERAVRTKNAFRIQRVDSLCVWSPIAHDAPTISMTGFDDGFWNKKKTLGGCRHSSKTRPASGSAAQRSCSPSFSLYPFNTAFPKFRYPSLPSWFLHPFVRIVNPSQIGVISHGHDRIPSGSSVRRPFLFLRRYSPQSIPIQPLHYTRLKSTVPYR